MRFPGLGELRLNLCNLFSEEAARRKLETAQQESRMDRDLARLGEWLTGVVGQLRQELEAPKDPTRTLGGFVHAFVHEISIDVDGSVFSAEQLKAIGPQYVALHDLCLKHDVSLEIAGFDRLPSNGTATNHSRSDRHQVAIEVDHGRTYNGHSHPNYWELRKAGVRLPLSVDRPEARTCGLQ